MSRLTMIEAKTADDFEAMRVIRNECAPFMTGDTKQLTQLEQAEWAATFDRKLLQPYLFEALLSIGSEGAIRGLVGYGIVRKRARYSDLGKGISGTWWVSGGLLPNWRGQRLGKELFGKLYEKVAAKGEICWLDVRTDNEPAIRTYRSLGFTELPPPIQKSNGVIVIEMFKDPRDRRQVP